MRRSLLLSSLLFLLWSCEYDSTQSGRDHVDEEDTSILEEENIEESSDPEVIDTIQGNSVDHTSIPQQEEKIIEHGSPDQDKLDSVKKAKTEKKK